MRVKGAISKNRLHSRMSEIKDTVELISRGTILSVHPL